MKTFTLTKRKWVLLAILFIGVITANAVNITYKLTTHDGRTLTASASVSAGASLEDNMPQDLWRGYTTYTFYSNPELTNKITTAPEEDAEVYVGYFFDPPFQISTDSKTVWNYIRNYVSGGSTQRYLYYDTSNKRVYQQKGTSVTSNKKIQWAFYGDGYNFNIKLNDSSIANPWLLWGGGNDRLQLGAKPNVGWQLYANAASSNSRPGGTVCIGRPDNGDLMYMPDLGIALKTQGIDTNDHQFDDHHQLVTVHSGSSSQATEERNELWLYAFFGSPVTSSSTTPDIWHVTYKIRKSDGTWYDDIVVQKTSSNLSILLNFPPEGFTPKEGDDYNYYYWDEDFTEWVDIESLPNDCNSILYAAEIHLVSTPWMTLVLPYDIDDLFDFFKAEVIEVDVLTSVKGLLSQGADGNYYYDCELNFQPTNAIEAYTPYLIRLGWVDEARVNNMYKTEGIVIDEDELENNKITLADQTNSPDVTVTMKGVLSPNGYSMDASDGLSFYFGSKYDEASKNYTYNFYRRSAIIPKNRCYFYITDESGQYSPLNLSFGSGTTGINVQAATSKKVDAPIYNINGQMMNKASKLQKGLYIVNGKKFIVK